VLLDGIGGQRGEREGGIRGRKASRKRERKTIVGHRLYYALCETAIVLSE